MDGRVDTDLRRIATRLACPLPEAVDQLAVLLRRPHARVEKPAVGELRRAPHRPRLEGAEPERNGPLHRQRVEPRLAHDIELALEGDQLLRPEQAQQLGLLPDAAAARPEILPQRLILDSIPAEADAEAQPAAGEQVELCRLLGDKSGLALRQNHYRRR